MFIYSRFPSRWAEIYYRNFRNKTTW